MLLLSWKIAISTVSYAFNFVYQGKKSLTKSFSAVKDKYWEFKENILWRNDLRGITILDTSQETASWETAQHFKRLRCLELPFLYWVFQDLSVLKKVAFCSLK